MATSVLVRAEATGARESGRFLVGDERAAVAAVLACVTNEIVTSCT
jgi:hypothetical protein